MNVLENFGLYLVRAFGLLAQWLGEITSPVPWPLVMAAAAVPLLFAANLIIWFLRGAVWPVRCKHPATTVRGHGDKACRRTVAGEWSYCRDHNRYKKNSKNQTVDPKLPRWQTTEGVDRTDIRGINSRVSLLFYHGFARKPAQVYRAFKEILPEWRNNILIMVKRLKREPAGEDPAVGMANTVTTAAERAKYRAFDSRAERADQALLFLKWMLPLAFVITAASAFIIGPWTTALEYAALLLLWIVVEAVRKGLLQAPGKADWRVQVVKGTLQGFVVVVAVAMAYTLLENYIFPFMEKILAA